jgi:predicted nucleotidyltransferase
MRIRSDELVAGFPAKLIRELLRQNDQYLSVIHVGKVLGLKGKKALRLLETLERQGFIKKNFTDSDATQYWRLTLQGSALSKALFSAPVSRRNAEKKLSELMDRVHQVNSTARFLYRVRKVVIFGSFLSESPTVGDLDIAIDLEPKEPNAKKHSDLMQDRADEAARNGKRFQNFVERLYFADREVRLFLKARSRIIQLTDCDDGVLKIAEHRVIYEYH